MADRILSKLNRIKGQVEGISRIYDKGEECEKIVQQVAAARAALAGVAKDLLTTEAVKCARLKKPKDFDKLINKLFKV